MMSSAQISFLDNFCRTCMGESSQQSKTHKTVSIFNKPECKENISVTIMELLILTAPQINVESGDMLPKILCENCLERLLSAYEFQQMCIRVEKKFLQMIKDHKHVNAQNSKDPLNESVVTDAINELTNILKIEMDEPLIDHNVSAFGNVNFIVDNEDVKFEADNNQWEESSNELGDGLESDNDTEFESQCTVVKTKKSSRTEVKQMEEENVKSYNNHKNTEEDDDKLEKQSSKTSKASRQILHASKSHDDGESTNFVCDECGNCLKTRKSLKRHKRIHLKSASGQTKTKYECEFCKKVFQQSSSLKDHLRIHTGEQPYLCSECGKAFKSLSNMKQHFLRHGTDRPYACPDCPKTFPCLSDLASHKAVHNKTKSHVCDICGAAFVKPYLLKKHKMYHTGEKNHKCDYCDMRFVLADQCRRHMRTHTGEKPYKCKYCERAFAQSNDLIKHLRGHLGDNVYKCDLCPQGFRLQGDLRTHFNTHKNDDEETKLRNLQALKEEEQKLQMKFGLME